jgi:phosphoserine phosphatase
MKTAFCFDLDGTITKEEMLVVLAKKMGLVEEFSLLTEATMAGVLPFAASFKLRIKILSALSISEVKQTLNKVKLSDKLVEFIKQNKQDCFIVTGNLDCYVEDIIKTIGCRCFSSIAEVEDGFVKDIKYIMDKSNAINLVRDLGYKKVIAIGDGSNDIPMFEQANLGIGYFAIKQKSIKEVIKHCDVSVFNEDSLCKILKTQLS